MALGSGGNFSTNKDGNNKYEAPTVYAPVRFRNPEATTDPSELSFSFWKNMLKVVISPKLEERAGDQYVMYDHNSQNNASILLSPMKAKMFHDDIIHMMEDDGIDSTGVTSGASGLITFSNGKEFGVDGYMLVIRKLDENGNVQSSYSYQFNKPEYYFSVRNYNESSHDYDRISHDNMEINYFLQLLEDFSNSQNFAYAYSNIDAGRFNFGRINTKIEMVMDKLGIENKPSNNNYNNRNSFFNNQKAGNNAVNMSDAGYNKSASSTTLEDLAGDLN